jgi:hypothetical protein
MLPLELPPRGRATRDPATAVPLADGAVIAGERRAVATRRIETSAASAFMHLLSVERREFCRVNASWLQ